MTRLAFVALLAPALLAAQEPDTTARAAGPGNPGRGIVAGVTGFTGGTWQPSGIELGLLWPLGRGGASTVSLTGRLGSFVQDQAVIYGSTQGFFTALLVGARTTLATIADVGSAENPSAVRFVGGVEAGGEVNFNSPLPQGSTMAIGAALAGISFGSGGGGIEQGFALLFGPAVFVGKATTTHVQVSLRYQNSF